MAPAAPSVGQTGEKPIGLLKSAWLSCSEASFLGSDRLLSWHDGGHQNSGTAQLALGADFASVR